METNTNPTNTHEIIARMKKAEKIAHALDKNGITYAEMLVANETTWQLTAALASADHNEHINPPSAETRRLIMENLLSRQAARDAQKLRELGVL